MINLDVFLKEYAGATSTELAEFNDALDNIEDIILYAFKRFRDKSLETRTPYLVLDGEKRVIGMGLSSNIEKVRIQFESRLHVGSRIMRIDAERYNEYLKSTDYPTWETFE